MDSPQIFDKYYNLSLRYLSYRPRSEKEISDYLKKKADRYPNLTEEIIVQIVEKLKSYEFIDDSKFAKFWIEQRSKYKNKPARVIRFELLQKGIDRELVDDLLEEIDTKSFDLENAKKLAERKWEFYRNLEPKKRREKVMNYLLRKGFSYDLVKKIEF
jgi:regulatory protein